MIEKNKQEIYSRLKTEDYSDDGEDSFGNFPRFPGTAPGAIFIGHTGCGKSTLLERVLARFPQALHRRSNKAAGWEKLDQLVYLCVHTLDEFVDDSPLSISSCLHQRFRTEALLHHAQADQLNAQR